MMVQLLLEHPEDRSLQQQLQEAFSHRTVGRHPLTSAAADLMDGALPVHADEAFWSISSHWH
jgi:hypothetical protein